MVKHEQNNSTQNGSEKGRILGRGYLNSPLQRRNWVLLILVVILVGGAVVGNKVGPLGAILTIAVLLCGTCALIGAALLQLEIVRPSAVWGRSAAGMALCGLGLIGKVLANLYQGTLPHEAVQLFPLLLFVGGIWVESRKA